MPNMCQVTTNIYYDDLNCEAHYDGQPPALGLP